MAPERIARFIQGVRMYCPKCMKQVTPVTYIINDSNGMTVGFDYECDQCNTLLKRMK